MSIFQRINLSELPTPNVVEQKPLNKFFLN